MKVKNDHRSKFSNLSNWKEEAWKNQGFNGIRTCDLRVTGALLIFTSKNDKSCGDRASELVSDKFICTYRPNAKNGCLINIFLFEFQLA